MIPRIFSRVILPIVLVIGLCSLPAINAAAKGKGGGGGGGNKNAKATPAPHHTTIESISADSITVDQPGGAKTYKITKFTDITYQGETVTVDQLQTGMAVEVIPDAVDDDTAGSIQADVAPKDPTPKPKRGEQAQGGGQ